MVVDLEKKKRQDPTASMYKQRNKSFREEGIKGLGTSLSTSGHKAKYSLKR